MTTSQSSRTDVPKLALLPTPLVEAPRLSAELGIRLLIKRDDLMGNVERANEFESKRQIAKIDKPLDRKEWGMTPPEVNAYYSGSTERTSLLTAVCGETLA